MTSVECGHVRFAGCRKLFVDKDVCIELLCRLHSRDIPSIHSSFLCDL